MRIDNHVIIRFELVLDVSNCVERSFRDLFDLNERGKPIYLLSHHSSMQSLPLQDVSQYDILSKCYSVFHALNKSC